MRKETVTRLMEAPGRLCRQTDTVTTVGVCVPQNDPL